MKRVPLKKSVLLGMSVGSKTFIVLLALILTLSSFYSLEVKAQDEYYVRDFEWDYNGSHWTWSLSIPKALYEEYKSVPVSTRVQDGPAGYGFLTTTNDYYLRMVAEKLNETALEEGFGSYDEVSFVLAFVQSLPYTSDSVTSGYNEYPRFPLETLVDGGGDCEDTSILFATITLIMGYGTVFVNPPEHYAVGVLGNNLDGSYYIHNGKTYYFCETTGDGWAIGEIPDDYKNTEAYIYDIYENQQYVADTVYVPPVSPYPSNTPSPTPSQSPSTSPTPSASPSSSTLLDDLFGSFWTMMALLFAVVMVVVVISLVVVKARQSAPQSVIAPPESKPIPEPASLNMDNGKFCRYCGSSNTMDAVFCEKCGKQIA
jgi:hypothetical protein